MTSLGIELEMLLFSAILYFVQIAISAAEADLRNGLAWGLSNRDDDPNAAAAFSGRAKRAAKNMAENLLPFACLVVIAVAADRTGEMSALGATVFFFSRVAHAGFYLAGVTVVRSLAYFGGIIGMGMIIFQVL